MNRFYASSANTAGAFLIRLDLKWRQNFLPVFETISFGGNVFSWRKKSFLRTFRGGNVFNWKMFSENISIQRALPKHPLFDLSSRGYPPQLSLIYCLYLSPYLVRKEPRLALRKVIAVHLVPLVLSRITVIYYLLSYKWRYLPTENTLSLLERPIRTQIYSGGTNKFWNSDKYILKSWQIHFTIWTNPYLQGSIVSDIIPMGELSLRENCGNCSFSFLHPPPSQQTKENKPKESTSLFCWKLYCLISFLTGGLYI